jgi:hypothetical protein
MILSDDRPIVALLLFTVFHAFGPAAAFTAQSTLCTLTKTHFTQAYDEVASCRYTMVTSLDTYNAILRFGNVI